MVEQNTVMILCKDKILTEKGKKQIPAPDILHGDLSIRCINKTRSMLQGVMGEFSTSKFGDHITD